MNLYKTEDKELVKDILLKGGIVAFGTDTVFGLACVYDDIKAIDKVFKAKDREAKKALPMMCSNIEMIDEVAYVSEDARKIMKAFMPGAITLIYKKKAVIDDYVTSFKDTIGIRIPDDEWILSLIESVGKPLLVTSANISGEPALFKWQDVQRDLGDKIDGLVMKDALGYQSSTIVDCSGENIKILREGPISEKQIIETIRR
ncbi:MAG: L-threonylcarbamoyladenylate synthase [Erysipelotrichaceae bacterium]|nr:L-threonylcarbamoyladenylate synthase [Erysipelotrichaceae bacterium]